MKSTLVVEVSFTIALFSSVAFGMQIAQNFKGGMGSPTENPYGMIASRQQTSMIGKSISISLNNVSIRDAIQEVSRQSGIKFTFSDDLLKNHKNVSLVDSQISVGDALDQILKETNITWVSTDEGQIVITSKEQLDQETGTVEGVVKDARTSESLPGVNIIVEGTSIGASTSPDGKYTINHVPEGTYNISARLLGYKKVTQSVSIKAGQSSTADFNLETSVLDLSEVVVTGVSVSTEKQQLGNAISTLNANQLDLTSTSQIDRALTGKIPGALVTQNSGSPDGGVSVRLRGTATVLGSSEPLYVLDGVIINNDSPVLMFLGGYTQNRLMDINPNDIERVEVVKGAAAAALYGSQANNGVVQFFSKKGSIGAPHITFSTSVQMDGLRKKLDLNMAPVDNSGNKNPDGSDVKRYDWQDEMFHTAVSGQQYISISGGTPTSRYFISGSQTGNEGILRGTFLRRVNGKVAVSQLINPDFNVSFDANYSYSKSNEVPNGGLESSYGAITGLLFGPNTVDPAKNSVTGLYPHNVNLTNPIEVIDLYDFHQDVGRFIGNAKVDLNLAQGLSADYTLGFDTYKQTAIAYIPIGTARTSVVNGFSRKGTRDFLQLTNDLHIQYLTEVSSDIKSTSLLGATMQFADASNFSAESNTLTPDAEIVTSGSIITLSELRTQSVIYGVFGQQSFTYLSKLTLTGGLRLDESSVFGINDRAQLYPKVSLSYVISNETFWKESVLQQIASSFKVRAAYGQSGGLSAIGPFDRFTSYTSVSLGGKAGVVPSTQLGASNVKPERQTANEIGFDAGFLEDRIGVEFTYYTQHTDDLLLFKSVNPSSGYLSQLSNIGTLDNDGIEISLKAIPLSSHEFQWTTTLSYASNKNKVDNIEGGRLIIPESFGLVAAVNGQPLGVYYGSAFLRDASGNIVYVNGIPQKAPNPKIIGDPNPDFTASWINEFDISDNFYVRAQFDAVIGNDVFNFSRRVEAFPSYGTGKDYERELNGQLPKGYNAAVYNIFENWIEDGSYVKCREISVTWTTYPNYLGIRALNLTLSGRNLFSIDNYQGYDPETNVAGQRTAVRGFDFAEVPIPRSFSLGATLNF